jgi:hypothetical protein
VHLLHIPVHGLLASVFFLPSSFFRPLVHLSCVPPPPSPLSLHLTPSLLTRHLSVSPSRPPLLTHTLCRRSTLPLASYHRWHHPVGSIVGRSCGTQRVGMHAGHGGQALLLVSVRIHPVPQLLVLKHWDHRRHHLSLVLC